MDKDTALDLALEALEDLQLQYRNYPNSFWDWSKGREAITAIKQARSAPVQEPVETGDTLFRQFMSQAEKAGITHWPTPPAAQPAPVQEPYARIYETEGPFGLHQSLECRSYNGRNPDRVVPVYTTPHTAQRQWVGLTDEERMEIYNKPLTIASCIGAVEAKLRSKNNG